MVQQLLMALSIEEIKKLIISSIPDATIEIKDLVGDNNHYSAKIISKIFSGKFTNHCKVKWEMNYTLCQ